MPPATGCFGDRFELQDYLGSGHFGAVHRCIDIYTQAEYAVKELSLSRMDRDDCLAAEEEIKVRCKSEVRCPTYLTEGNGLCISVLLWA